MFIFLRKILRFTSIKSKFILFKPIKIKLILKLEILVYFLPKNAFKVRLHKFTLLPNSPKKKKIGFTQQQNHYNT